MVHLEESWLEDRRIVGIHRQVKPESSLVSGAAEGSSHQTGRSEGGLCPTKPKISRPNM